MLWQVRGIGQKVTHPPEGLKKYHLFLVGTYPSSKFSGAELANQNLTVCLDFTSDWINSKPVVCHPIKESEIPLKNDSVIDKLFYDLSDPDVIYQEARAYEYCIHDYPEDDLNRCVRQVT